MRNHTILNNKATGFVCLIATLLFLTVNLRAATTEPLAVLLSRTTYPLELSRLKARQATAASRAKMMHNMRDTTIPLALRSPVTSETEDLWDDAFWSMKLLMLDTGQTRVGMKRALKAYSQRSQDYKRAVLEAAYTLNPTAFTKEVSAISRETTYPKHFAMAALYLARASDGQRGGAGRSELLSLMRRRFPDWQQNPILVMLNYQLHADGPDAGVGQRGRKRVSIPRSPTSSMRPAMEATDTSPVLSRPPLRYFFSRDFAPGYPVVYTLQRRQRDYPGIAVVRGYDGKFMRNPAGNLFSITHLARSLSNLPGYITNGNTPEGVFSILGLGVTRSRAIGQTPFLETVLPFERSAGLYLHNPQQAQTTMTAELYRNLLPGHVDEQSGSPGSARSWRDYFPIYSALYAGMAGRSEMLSHGTTVDGEYYRGKPFYPNTPTIGCICANEQWDLQTGRAIYSDQLALVRTYLAACKPVEEEEAKLPHPEHLPQGFFVVINIDDERRPVMLDDVITEIIAAERQR